jgi:hypothetical protein
MGLLSSFFGKDQRRDLEAAKAQSDAQLQQGFNQGQSDYAAAENYFSPYAQEGQRGIEDQNFYRKLLMGDGGATGTLAGNPLFQGELGQNSNAVARGLNAQGASGGGKAQLAAQRVFQGTAGNWVDRFRGLGESGINTGMQATNAMAGLRSGRGDMAYGYGATKAGNSINFGNAMAANRNTGVNNLMGLAGLAVNAFTGGMTPKLGGK